VLGFAAFSASRSNWARILLSTNYYWREAIPWLNSLGLMPIGSFTMGRKAIYTEYNLLPTRVYVPKYDGNDVSRCGVVMLDNPALHLQLPAEFRG
jgi:hypothetical protein